MRFLENKNVFRGKDWLKLDNAAKVFPGQVTKTWANIIRYSINLTVEIDPELLKQALTDILPRFPSMCVKIKRGFFWYYFEYNDKIPVITEEPKEKFATIKYSESNGFLFKIFYCKNRLSIETFHALTDGYGCEVFLNTLAAQYLRLLGHSISVGGSVFDINEIQPAYELEDSFLKNATRGASSSRSKPNVYHKKGEKLPAFYSHVTTGYIPLEKVKELCKKHQVTITEFFTAVLVEIYIAFQKQEEKKQKQISIQVPVNARNQFDSQTMRNFSVCYSVRIDPNLGEYTFEEILKQVSLYLRYINNPKTLGAMFASNIKLESSPLMRVIPLVIKDLAIGISYALTAETTTTALFTNLGKVDLPEEMYKFVESCTLLPPAGLLNGGRIGAVSVKDTLTVAVANCYKDTDVEKAFFGRLVELGLPVKLENDFSYDNAELIKQNIPTPPIPQKEKRRALFVTSVLLLLPALLSIALSTFLPEALAWSPYLVVGGVMLWLIAALPFILRKRLSKLHSLLVTSAAAAIFSILTLFVTHFFEHSIIIDCVVAVIGFTALLLSGLLSTAKTNKRLKAWLSKKFYF